MEEESSGRSKGRRRHVDSDLPIPSLSKAYENRRTGGALGKSTGNHAGKDADIIGASSFFCPPSTTLVSCAQNSADLEVLPDIVVCEQSGPVEMDSNGQQAQPQIVSELCEFLNCE
ncbi:hypothetical protein AXG93_2958s1060 [Marchantia polymorpha subsp. ruderalis]|uniref:Uncharacterized protein n=1 Tax=Marchantia polymorpha subsp. ruderalis TaxID=1480154 RepID=A0A176VHC0_MARPO|nr:hypothetical protein AXG93_2958s1060 [Marchantia polymorpha subsp. ruderalis]